MSINSLPELAQNIDRCMIRDRHFLRRAIKRAQQSKSTLEPSVLDRYERSFQQFEYRKQNLPVTQLADSLPVSQRSDEIGKLVLEHQVVVVCGETGSGKSTQLPLICLNHGIGVGGMIGHTQPRRIAARGVAAQIARQVGSPLGNDVGFKIRFDDKTQDNTFVKLMTDGILLAETQSDRFLDRYEMIIVDEAHERSLNIDFLLGYLKTLLIKRRDLKLIITSATIDANRFSEHFTFDQNNPVPIIEVAGRTYPVETRYVPVEDESEIDINDHAIDQVEELVKEGQGDILIFFPTENDIRQVSKQLRGRVTSGRLKADIVPLYARLSTEQQNEAFAPSKLRKIVLATNVAESSITVPGIRFVIDTGTARISRYAPKSKVQRLPIEPIAQASADQRAGRCGRVGPGICVRLYSADDYLARPKYTTPEIRRTNLASVILQTKALKLGDIESFPFLDPPHPDAIRDGFKTLFEIGAIDSNRALTALGQNLSKLPVDPRIGRMIYAADQEGCLAEILIIAAALEIQDPRDRPVEKQKQADLAHEKFIDENSDFLSYLKIWDFAHKAREELSRSQYRKACIQNFLSQPRMQQWFEIHRQLKSMVRSAKMHIGSRKDDYTAIHRSLLTGLLSGTATLNDKFEYTGAGGLKFFLWPGSNLFERKPKWVVVAEIVETGKRFGRNIGKIQPQWIEPIAKHLVKLHHFDPHWSEKNDACMVHERVTLFGLTIVPGRRVYNGKLDPVTARQFLIQKGLVEHLMRRPFKFLSQNVELLEKLNQRAAKTRDRKWVIDEHVVYEFYDRNLPDDAIDGKSLSELINRNSSDLEQRLTMTEADLVPESSNQFSEDAFPNKMHFGELSLPVEYCFEPGNEADGLTLKVPQKAIGQIKTSQLGWLVPGLVESKIMALIRSLPKRQRRSLVPAPDTAKAVAEELEFGKGDFETVVAKKLSDIAQEPIKVDDFALDKIDRTLRFNVQVIDDDGSVATQGRDLKSILSTTTNGGETAPAIEDARWNQTGLTQWSFDEIPEVVNVKQGNFVVPLYPAIVDNGQSVSQQLFDSKTRAKHETRAGLTRLFQLNYSKQIKSQVNWLPDLDRDVLKFNGRFSEKQTKSNLGDLIARLAILENQKLPVTRQQYDERCDNAVEKISIATQQIVRWFSKTAEAYHLGQLQIESMQKATLGESLADVKSQLREIFAGNWPIQIPWRWLEQFPRYLSAIEYRLSKLSKAMLMKDKELTSEVGQFWSIYASEVETRPESVGNRTLIDFRWMIEEYRVSLFAQSIGTSVKVSPQRLEKQWEKYLSEINQ